MTDPGISWGRHHVRGAGFTLVEVLVVLFIVGLAGTLVGLGVGLNPITLLEDESDRLRQILETGLDRSRLTRAQVLWQAGADGYVLTIRDGGTDRPIAKRDLGSPIRILAVWREGTLLQAPYELTLSGRNPVLFRISLGVEQGARFELRSGLLGRIELVRGE